MKTLTNQQQNYPYNETENAK